MPFVDAIEPTIVAMPWTDDIIRFVWSTDEHMPNETTSEHVAWLRAAVDDCNEWLPNAYISTGDIGNNYLYQVQRYMSEVRRLRRPFYVALGNHDVNEYPEERYGDPHLEELSYKTSVGLTWPFYHTTQLVSGDGTVKARCIFVDAAYYAPDPNEVKISEYHEDGDPIGNSNITPSGGWLVQVPQSELTWIAAQLAADTESQFVLVFVHYPSASQLLNFAELVDVLQFDGRPAVGFCGHQHGSALLKTITTTDEARSYTFYKAPALLECGAWVRCEFGYNSNPRSIVVQSLELQNYNPPSESWTVESPFTVAT